MKKFIVLILSLISIYTVKAQNSTISATAGICFNGTGDTKGPIYSTEYSKYFKNSKFFWSASFGGTIHDGSFPVFYEYPIGTLNDGSVYYTIAGFQTDFCLGKNFLKSDSKEFFLKIGPVIRYQSSSYWDSIEVLSEAITGFPIPVVIFYNSTPPRTLAIGACSQIGYSFAVANNFTLGIIGGFQFDSQGDNLSYLTVKFGKRF